MKASTHYVRFEHNNVIAYGELADGQIRTIDGDLFSNPKPTGETIALEDVRLLTPCEPSKVIAVGLNYQSHLGGREAPDIPPIFLKLPTSIIGYGESIVLPADAPETHFEAEMVLVIGKKAKNVSEADAADYIFGVTCGNDVSARKWQKNDLQWFRAKGTDTFGPIGPAIATGLDYNDLQLEGRLNGEVVQSQRTSDLSQNCAAILSFVTRYVTLLPGDIIFTGTPGNTSELSPGDTFEVELEGVGVLSNPVARAADTNQ
jgi:2-keto-4-pentenoate hydratase/2-oxohepta-3-ene-1,7-dioic acid hydratase in catechol pathway